MMQNENKAMEEYGKEQYREGIVTGIVWTLAAVGTAVIISCIRN